MKRVKAKMTISYNHESDEYTETLFQYLQESKSVVFMGVKWFSYWHTIDKEIVPTYAWIQRNTLGSTDWKSKWYELNNVTWLHAPPPKKNNKSKQL